MSDGPGTVQDVLLARYGPEGERLFHLVAGLGTTYGFERSVKIRPRELLDERFLLTVHKNSFAPDPVKGVMKIYRKLNAPDVFESLIRQYMPSSNIIHIGFENSAESAIYKLYLEFSPETRNLRPPEDRNLVYLSLKWDVAIPSRRAVARYSALPPMAASELIAKLPEKYDFKEKSSFFRLVGGLLEQVAPSAENRALFVLDVVEDENPRRSFDVNLYDANLRVADIAAPLRDILVYFNICEDDISAFYKPIRGERLGHFSAGIDRGGREFATVFFGVTEGPAIE